MSLQGVDFYLFFNLATAGKSETLTGANPTRVIKSWAFVYEDRMEIFSSSTGIVVALI